MGVELQKSHQHMEGTTKVTWKYDKQAEGTEFQGKDGKKGRRWKKRQEPDKNSKDWTR